MNSDVVISAVGLGKKYVIGHESERERQMTFRDVIERAAKNLARTTVEMARGGAIVAGDSTEEFWALKGINFEVERGDVVGIIGRNGAGKSTLLKILSRITEPSAGHVAIKGRVASLLEVGTGFHPELTGRENIYLNGAILGMTRAEIRRKFDEIVAFAEIEKFLDTPVKRYSSGMYVRLAFAVAAHLEPEILIIDEVLAVGDAEFQKKCLGKMQDVAGHGRTVLLVSHNMGTLSSICGTGLLLEGGNVRMSGEIEAVLRAYRSKTSSGSGSGERLRFNGPLESVKVEWLSLNERPLTGHSIVNSDEELAIELKGTASVTVPQFRFSVALFCQGSRIVSFHDGPSSLPAGRFCVRLNIPSQLLRPGEYSIAAGGRRVAGDEWFWATDLATIEVIPKWGTLYDQDDVGVFNLSGRLERSLQGA